MTRQEAIELFGQEFVDKINHIKKEFNGQKVWIINDLQERRPFNKKQKKKT